MIELLASEPEQNNSQPLPSEVVPTKRRYRTRSEILFDKQSERRMSLAEQIDLASKWFRAARTEKAAYRWCKLLAELREKLPPRKPKSKPGVNMQRILRAERAQELNAARKELKEKGDGNVSKDQS